MTKRNIVFHNGTNIQLPEGISMADAIKILSHKIREEDERVYFHETIEALPLERAYALQKAMDEMFGSSSQNADLDGQRNFYHSHIGGGIWDINSYI